MWEAGFASCQLIRYLCLTSLTFHIMPVVIKLSLLPNLSYLELKINVLDGQDIEALWGVTRATLPSNMYTKYKGIVSSTKTPNGGYFQKLRVFNTPFCYVRFDLHGIMFSEEKAVMSNLRYLEFLVYVWILKDAGLSGFNELLNSAHLGTNSSEVSKLISTVVVPMP